MLPSSSTISVYSAFFWVTCTVPPHVSLPWVSIAAGVLALVAAVLNYMHAYNDTRKGPQELPNNDNFAGFVAASRPVRSGGGARRGVLAPQKPALSRRPPKDPGPHTRELPGAG